MSGPKGTPLGRIRNIGIIAHIDAGKTTTSERILFYAGKEHRMGEVHEGTAVMDYLQDEQERGITITSAATTFSWLDHQINLIDTPGHVDFTAEVERSLRVLDGAVVVFCGVGGVEAQSETVWHQADRYQVPRLAFINKLDRSGAELDHVLQEMRDRLHANPLPLQVPVGVEENFRGVIDLVRMQFLTFDEADQGRTVQANEIPADLKDDAEIGRLHLVETVAESSEALMEKYLAEEELSEEEIRAGIRELTLKRQVVPIFCGSSLKNKGVQPLLDGVVHYLPSPKDVPEPIGHNPENHAEEKPVPLSRKDPLVALVFKVLDDSHGPLCFARIYSGEANEGDRIIVAHSGRKERLSRLWRMHADERVRETSVGPGEIVAISGLKFAATGDSLVAEGHRVELEPPRFPATVISMAIEPRTNDDRDKLSDVLGRLTREDPTFAFRTDDETGQLLISGMGELHLDIIKTRIERDYKVSVNSGTPRVTYRESIAHTGNGRATFEQEVGGKPLYAALSVEILPHRKATLPAIEFATEDLLVPRFYHSAIEEGLKNGCLSGPLGGYPLINLSIRVIGGGTRDGQTNELAFTVAAENALRQAVDQAGAQLLEPIMNLEVTTPEEFMGNVIHDLNGRAAEIGEIGSRGPLRVVHAKVPLAEMFGYATVVRSLSTGRAAYSMEPHAYAPVARHKIAGILGYDPFAVQA